eukprot:3198325-Amphidinium_carterae.1
MSFTQPDRPGRSGSMQLPTGCRLEEHQRKLMVWEVWKSGVLISDVFNSSVCSQGIVNTHNSNDESVHFSRPC